MGNSALYSPWKKACLLLLAVFVFPVVAQEEDDLDFASMSLEDLLNVEVVTASKQAESINDAPAVVTTISAAELERFGALDLQDALQYVTGVQTQFNELWRQSTIRKGDPFQALAHSLFLLNGRVFQRESNRGSGEFAALTSFPLEAIERIEVVRGPGSVLYGTNAYQGVINIITKDPEESGIVVNAITGSESGKGTGVYANYTKDDFSLMVSGHYFDEEGWLFDGTGFLGAGQVNQFDFEDNSSVMVEMRYKAFTVTASESSMKRQNLGFSFFGLSNHNEQRFINVGYDWVFNDNWHLDTNWTANKNEFSFVEIGVDRNSDDWLVETTLYGKLGEKTNMLIGGVFENITGDDNSELADWDENNKSAYFQIDHRFNDKVKGIIGGQYNEPENVEGKFVPRVGAIFTFNERSGAKVLYGQAFRAPNKFEQTVDQIDQDPPLFGPNLNLDFETITTTDLQLYYNADNFSFTGTLFNSKQEDLIAVIPDPNPNSPYLQIHDNVGELDMQGIELEIKYVPNEKWFVLGSVSHQENEDNNDVDDATLSPNTEVKLGIAYNTKSFSFGIFNSYFSEYADNQLRNADRLALNPESDAYNWLTAKFTYDFHNIGGIKKISLYAYGRNLLDEEIWTPEVFVNTVNTTGELSGVTAYGGVRVAY